MPAQNVCLRKQEVPDLAQSCFCLVLVFAKPLNHVGEATAIVTRSSVRLAQLDLDQTLQQTYESRSTTVGASNSSKGAVQSEPLSHVV